jgi:hypothetical protein
MLEIDEQTLRDQLKAKLNSLHLEYRKDPSNTRLALEIKLIDDLIASLSKYLVTEKARSSNRDPARNRLSLVPPAPGEEES